MENYTFLRELADSWMLLAMFSIFVGTWFWAFRPGSRSLHDDAADVVFRHEKSPDEPCDGRCESCKCVSDDLNFGPEGQS